jgi:hypothetical protein
VERRDLLGVYLNDHLAGATAGTRLARRMANAQAGPGPGLEGPAAEISEDRAALLEIMKQLGVPIRHYKVAAGWFAENTGRLKPNRHLLRRSPLSDLLELEMLRLGVEGKAAGWQTLRTVADSDPGLGLDRDRLDELLHRARTQAETLEKLRIQQAAEVFGKG